MSNEKLNYDYAYALDIMIQELDNKYISPEIHYAFKASIQALKNRIIVKPGETMVFSCDVCHNLFSVRSLKRMDGFKVICPSCSCSRHSDMTDVQKRQFNNESGD